MKARSTEKELLDAENIPQADLYQNLRELETINRLLGGHALNRKAFLKSLPSIMPDELFVVELASGGGDNLRDLARYCREQGINARFVGVDLKPDCIAFAQEASEDFPEISFFCADYRDFTPERKIDICFSSLFCHHLSAKEITLYLDWNRKHAAHFFVNDLQRHILAEKSIALLTVLFSKSYLVKNDAPASVRRGFSKMDWLSALNAFHFTANLSWHWAFRWMLVVRNERE